MMNLRIAVPIIVLFGFIYQSVPADTVYQCIDKQGNRTFSDRCPPGTRKQETSFQTAAPQESAEEDSARAPVILYTVDQCDACDLVRNFLQTRSIPFTEKNVTDDPDLQKEVREKSASTMVPIALIGSTILRGYDSFALKEAIAAAGYPDSPEQSGSDDAGASGKPPEND